MESDPALQEECQTDFDTRYRWWVDYFNRADRVDNISVHRVIFVAMIKLNIVGYIAGHLTPRPNPRGEIQSLNILKPQWGKGVGINLLRNLGRWFKNQGVASVCVNVAEHDPYKKFYEKHGATAVNNSLYQWDDIGKILEKP